MADEFDQWVQNYSQMKKNASVADKLDIISMQLLEIEENTKKVPEIAQEIEGQNNEIDQANQEAGAMPGMPPGMPPAGAPPAGAPPGAEGGAPAPMGNDGLVPAGPVEASASPKKVIRSKHSIAKESTEKSGFQETPEAKSSAAFDDLLRVLGDAVKESAQSGNSALAIQLSNIQEAVEQLINDSDLPEDEKKKLKKAVPINTEYAGANQRLKEYDQGRDISLVESQMRRLIGNISRELGFIQSKLESTIPRSNEGNLYINSKEAQPYIDELMTLARILMTPKEYEERFKDTTGLTVDDINALRGTLQYKLRNKDRMREVFSDEGGLSPDKMRDISKLLNLGRISTVSTLGYAGIESDPNFAGTTLKGQKTLAWPKIYDSLNQDVPKHLFNTDRYFFFDAGKYANQNMSELHAALNKERQDKIRRYFKDFQAEEDCEQFCIDTCNWIYGTQIQYLAAKESFYSKMGAHNVFASQMMVFNRQRALTLARLENIFRNGTIDQKIDAFMTCCGQRDNIALAMENAYGSFMNSRQEQSLLAYVKQNEDKSVSNVGQMVQLTKDLTADINAINMSHGDLYKVRGLAPLHYCLHIPQELREGLRETANNPATLLPFLYEVVNEDTKAKTEESRSTQESDLVDGQLPTEATSEEEPVTEENYGGENTSDATPESDNGYQVFNADDDVTENDEEAAESKPQGPIMNPDAEGLKTPTEELPSMVRAKMGAIDTVKSLANCEYVQSLINSLKDEAEFVGIKPAPPETPGILIEFKVSDPSVGDGGEVVSEYWKLEDFSEDMLKQLGKNPEKTVALASSASYDSQGNYKEPTNADLWAVAGEYGKPNPYGRESKIIPGSTGEPVPIDADKHVGKWFNDTMLREQPVLNEIYNNLLKERQAVIKDNLKHNPILDDYVSKLDYCLDGLIHTVPREEFLQRLNGVIEKSNEIMVSKDVYEGRDADARVVLGRVKQNLYHTTNPDEINAVYQGYYDKYKEASNPFDAASAKSEIMSGLFSKDDQGAPIIPEKYGTREYVESQISDAVDAKYKHGYATGTPITPNFDKRMELLKKLRKAERVIGEATGLSEYEVNHILSEHSPAEVLELANKLRQFSMWEDITDTTEDEVEESRYAEIAKQVLSYSKLTPEDKGARLSRLCTKLSKVLGDAALSNKDRGVMGVLAWKMYVEGNKQDPYILKGFLQAGHLSPNEVLVKWMKGKSFTTDPALQQRIQEINKNLVQKKQALSNSKTGLHAFAVARLTGLTLGVDKEKDEQIARRLCLEASSAYKVQLKDLDASAKEIAEAWAIQCAKNNGQPYDAMSPFQKVLNRALVRKYNSEALKEFEDCFNYGYANKLIILPGENTPERIYLDMYGKMTGEKSFARLNEVVNTASDGENDIYPVLKNLVQSNKGLVEVMEASKKWADGISTVQDEETESKLLNVCDKLGKPTIFSMVARVTAKQKPQPGKPAESFTSKEVEAANHAISELKDKDRETDAVDQDNVSELLDEDYIVDVKSHLKPDEVHPYFSQGTVMPEPLRPKEDMSQYDLNPTDTFWDTLYGTYEGFLKLSPEDRAKYMDSYDLLPEDLEYIEKFGKYKEAIELAESKKDELPPEELSKLYEAATDLFNELPLPLQAYISRNLLEEEFGTRLLPTPLASSAVAEGNDLNKFSAGLVRNTRDVLDQKIQNLADLATTMDGQSEDSWGDFKTAKEELDAAREDYLTKQELQNSYNITDDAIGRYHEVLNPTLLSRGEKPQFVPWMSNVVVVPDASNNQTGQNPQIPMTLRDAIAEDDMHPARRFARNNFSSSSWNAERGTFEEDYPAGGESEITTVFPKINSKNMVSYPDLVTFNQHVKERPTMAQVNGSFDNDDDDDDDRTIYDE